MYGDCEAKTILLASIFEGKGLPYEVRASFNHIWVDYPGRAEREGESASLAYLEGEPGRFRFHWPDRVAWSTFFKVQRAQLWDAMPLARRAIWLVGVVWALLASLMLGGKALAGDLISRWRLRPRAYLGRVGWLALAVFIAIALAPNLRPELRPVRWTLMDLREVLALCVVAGAFLVWLGALRPRRAVRIAGDELIASWSFGLFRGSRRLDAGAIDHFELTASGGASPWLLAAALRDGERVSLLTHRSELAARAALRRLGLSFSRPFLVRSSGSEYWTAIDEIGLNVAQKSAQRPQQTEAARPDDCHLALEQADGHWALGYPRREKGATRVLLSMGAVVFMSGALAAIFLALAPRNLIAWIVWVSSVVLLGMTAYAAMCLRDEILAWLGGSHVEVGDGRLTFHKAVPSSPRSAFFTFGSTARPDIESGSGRPSNAPSLGRPRRPLPPALPSGRHVTYPPCGVLLAYAILGFAFLEVEFAWPTSSRPRRTSSARASGAWAIWRGHRSARPTVAAELTRQACRQLDKAATKGVIHRRQAARRKSRLGRRLAAIETAAE
jgi:hypothetical protein